jgi:ABC-type lipoprotein release transport system permease subunit
MKWRTAAIAIVVALAMAMIVSGLYGSAVMDESVERFFIDSRMPDVFVDFNEPVNASQVDAVLGPDPDVESYDMRLKMGGTFTTKDNEVVQVILIGTGDPARVDINIMEMIEGRFFSGSGEANAVGGMEDKGAKKDATVTVQTAGTSITFDIVGTIRSPEYVFPTAYADLALPTQGNLMVLYVPLPDLQALIDLDDGVNDAIFLLNDQGADQEVIDSLDQFGIKSVVHKEVHPSVVFMDLGSAKIKNMMPVIGFIFLFIGFITVFMTMARLIQTDSRYIGVLMSLGYNRAEIVRSYLMLGLVITIIGVTLGVIFSLAFTYLMVGAGISLYMTITLHFPFEVVPFIVGALFIAAAVLISVAIPVAIITRSSVREALEYKPRGTVTTTRVGGKSSRLTRMGLRNTTRNPARLAITVVVVGITIGTAGMWLVMLDSAFGYMEDQIDSNTWDLRAGFNVPVNGSEVNAESLNLDPADTSYVIPYTAMSVIVQHGSKQVGAYVYGADEMARTKDFVMREGKADFTGAVLSSKLADEVGAGDGDMISLLVGSSVVTLEVAGVSQEAVALIVYTNRDVLAPLFPIEQVNGAYIQLVDPDTSPDMAKDVREVPFVAGVLEIQAIKDSYLSMLEMAWGFFITFFLISAVITLAVAGSAVIISAMERDVEFATLDTLGFSRWHVAKVITIEMGVLALISSAIGIPMSYVLGLLLVDSFAEVLFEFPVILAAGAMTTTFFLGVVFVLMSSMMPIRYSWKLDTEQTIRERTAG